MGDILTKFCTECGFEIDDNVNFCTNCGAKVKQYAKDNIQPSETKSRGLFNRKSNEQKEAIKEIDSYRKATYKKFREIVPRYGINSVGYSEGKYFNSIIKTIKKEIENDGLTIDKIELRVHELLKEKYGEPMSQEEALQSLEQARQQPKIEKEQQLEKKFGVQFHDRLWFKCTVEEMRHSSISNINERDVVDGYVFIEDTFLEIIKESVFLKSNMGSRKIFFDNIASIDYDARGRLHVGSNLEIYLKSSDRVQLKYVDKEMANLVTSKYNAYMDNKSSNINANEGTSNVDELMKYADLYERGLLTKEEFDLKKKELL